MVTERKREDRLWPGCSREPPRERGSGSVTETALAAQLHDPAIRATRSIRR